MDYKHDEITKGIQVTTVCNMGGVGVGYLMPNGKVYRTTGSYWLAECNDLRGYLNDGGQGYKDAIFGKAKEVAQRQLNK